MLQLLKFDTLQLLMPPNELAEEENYQPVLEEYKKKYIK